MIAMAKFQSEFLHWINYIHLERISSISWCRLLFHDLVKSHSARPPLTIRECCGMTALFISLPYKAPPQRWMCFCGKWCVSLCSDKDLTSAWKTWIEYFIESESYFSCWESLHFWSCIKYCYRKWVQRLENMRRNYQNLGFFFLFKDRVTQSHLKLLLMDRLWYRRMIPGKFSCFFLFLFNLSSSISNPLGNSLILCKV